VGIEQAVNNQLNKIPGVKRVVKRCYQGILYALSPKVKVEGDVRCVSPQDDRDYFFGYYDKSPWSSNGRYMLCMAAEETWSQPAPDAPLDILIVDVESGVTRRIADSRAWNVQQGCMAQWLGPDFNSEVIYNDFREGAYCSVIYNIDTDRERLLPQPVYAVTNDGTTALTLDFGRLHTFRPGYGYSSLPDSTKEVKVPEGFCVWRVDLCSGECTGLLSYDQIVSFEPRGEMRGAFHKVNHIMVNPCGNRFMFLHRWFCGQRKYSRLLTCDLDGENLYCLSDDDMVSHCYWKSDSEIIAFENKRDYGHGYYLMKDLTSDYKRLWEALDNDGHPSYSPDRSHVLTDTYPDRRRLSEVKVLEEGDVTGKEARVVARVFSPFRYDNDTRCDLHPRWSPDGRSVCFDAAFEGRRRLYVAPIGEVR